VVLDAGGLLVFKDMQIEVNLRRSSAADNSPKVTAWATSVSIGTGAKAVIRASTQPVHTSGHGPEYRGPLGSTAT
jgi:hypothetical protein